MPSKDRSAQTALILINEILNLHSNDGRASNDGSMPAK
jgi:hypothetical protein